MMNRPFVISRILLSAAVILTVLQIHAEETIPDKIQIDIPSQLDYIKCSSWTDGYEYVKYVPTDLPDFMGIKNVSAEEKETALFMGGSTNEGGTCLLLRELPDKRIVIDNRIPYQFFTPGCNVTLAENGNCLIVRKPSGNLEGVLTVMPEEIDLEQFMINDLLKFFFAGDYVDRNGKLYSFSKTECKNSGFPNDGQYTIEKIFLMPTTIITTGNKTYSVRKTLDGLIMTPLKKDEEYSYKMTGEAPLYLTAVNKKYDFPLTSEVIMTRYQLNLYAGYYAYAEEVKDTKAEEAKHLNALNIMRNEIFARHGYIFKSRKWKDYFEAKSWYKPTKKDVSNELSLVEKINIEQLRNMTSFQK